MLQLRKPQGGRKRASPPLPADVSQRCATFHPVAGRRCHRWIGADHQPSPCFDTPGTGRCCGVAPGVGRRRRAAAVHRPQRAAGPGTPPQAAVDSKGSDDGGGKGKPGNNRRCRCPPAPTRAPSPHPAQRPAAQRDPVHQDPPTATAPSSFLSRPPITRSPSDRQATPESRRQTGWARKSHTGKRAPERAPAAVVNQMSSGKASGSYPNCSTMARASGMLVSNRHSLRPGRYSDTFGRPLAKRRGLTSYQ